MNDGMRLQQISNFYEPQVASNQLHRTLSKQHFFQLNRWFVICRIMSTSTEMSIDSMQSIEKRFPEDLTQCTPSISRWNLPLRILCGHILDSRWICAGETHSKAFFQIHGIIPHSPLENSALKNPFIYFALCIQIYRVSNHDYGLCVKDLPPDA